jgi:hypothetical protein
VTSQEPAPTPLLVTVDVEGDNLWSRPRRVTTKNAQFLPRFHGLCRRYGLRPTYLATFEMATSPAFQAFGRGVVAADEGEIGTHLHAWNSPPHAPITDCDDWYQPYATQYPAATLRVKTEHLTRLVEDTFQVPVHSHRGGRWAFNEACARVLASLGYRVDSSVTPHINWQRSAPTGVDGHAPDYTRFPERPYFVDLGDVRRPGGSALLEVPLTTCRIPFDSGTAAPAGAGPSLIRWLRPNGRNVNALRWVVEQALAERRPCLVLMLHSSELMPGGSPALPGVEHVEALYRDLHVLFEMTSGRCRGSTLSEFYQEMAVRGDTPARCEC